MLKVFVWTDFCLDYSSGLAFAIAKTEKAAKAKIVKVFGNEPYQWGDLHVHHLGRAPGYYVVGSSG